MHTINAVRHLVLERHQCLGNSEEFCGKGGKFIEFWEKLNRRAAVGIDWKNCPPNIDDRPILSDGEFDALLEEGAALK